MAEICSWPPFCPQSHPVKRTVEFSNFVAHCYPPQDRPHSRGPSDPGSTEISCASDSSVKRAIQSFGNRQDADDERSHPLIARSRPAFRCIRYRSWRVPVAKLRYSTIGTQNPDAGPGTLPHGPAHSRHSCCVWGQLTWSNGESDTFLP